MNYQITVVFFGWDLIGNSNVCFIQLILKKTIQEKIYPKGTIEKLINSLPDAKNFIIRRINKEVTITDVTV